MKFVNNTDETIVLRPGEGISGGTTVREFHGTIYRMEVDRVSDGPKDASEFTNPVEREINRHD